MKIMEKNTYASLFETYSNAWAETDATERMKLLNLSVDPECTYTDPLLQVIGYGPLSGYMAELQKDVPGIHFVTTDFKTHHDQSLVHWNMVNGDGHVLAPGTSFLRHAPDGRLKQMSGFFEQPVAV